MGQLDTIERILHEKLSADDGLAIVRHVLGNPCGVEYVLDPRRQMEGRVVGARIRPLGGSSPIRVLRDLDSGAIQYERAGAPVRHPSLEPQDRVSLLVATQGYGRWLPAVFTRGVQRKQGGGGAQEADFLRRFLLVFQTVSHETQVRVQKRDRIVDSIEADPRFLPWLASWLGFALDDRIPVTRRRIFLRRAVELFRWRGTIAGIREMVRTLTGLPVEIIERRGPQPMELGNCALSRPPEPDGTDPRDAASVAMPFVTHAGEHLLVSPRFSREEYFTIVLEERDVLYARFRDRLKDLLEQIVRIASAERPAHLSFVISFRDEKAAHNELVLAPYDEVTPNSVLGRACLAGGT